MVANSHPLAQWHQWLRHVREHPPSIQEQQQDLVRQAQIKELARLADERWASKPSFLDKPKTQPVPTQTNNAALSETPASDTHPVSKTQASTPSAMTPDPEPASTATVHKKNPWNNASNANPGEEWQPEAWSPNSKR